jgi:hypothetical protein
VAIIATVLMAQAIDVLPCLLLVLDAHQGVPKGAPEQKG